MLEIDRALSIRAAAAEAGERPFVIDAGGEAISFAAMSRGLGRLEPGSFGTCVASPTLEVVQTIVAHLEARAPIVPLHPRWTSAERERALEATRAGSVGPELLAILFTSGTSGTPKGARLSRRAFVGAAAASAARLGWRENDRWLLAMPLAHVGGLSVLVRTLIARRTIVLAPEGPFDARRMLTLAEQREVSLLSLVPTQLARLVELGARAPGSVRAVLLGGAACPEPVLERAVALGWPLHTTYGLTETCAQVSTAEMPVRSAADGVGRPLAGIEVEIREGRIHVRSPFAMDGWLDPEAAPPFDADGFYDTGDLGELDARGRLHVHTRREDLIVTGGENVYPAEIERALLEIDGILEACVVGVPDETWGQRVAAAIVVRTPLEPAGVVVTLRERLAGFKVPRSLVTLEALPTNAVGKVDRAAVRALVRGAP